MLKKESTHRHPSLLTKSSKVLVFLVAGSAAEQMERKPESEVVASAMGVLRRAYPDAPDPAHYVISKWCSDRCVARVSVCVHLFCQCSHSQLVNGCNDGLHDVRFLETLDALRADRQRT